MQVKHRLTPVPDHMYVRRPVIIRIDDYAQSG